MKNMRSFTVNEFVYRLNYAYSAVTCFVILINMTEERSE